MSKKLKMNKDYLLKVAIDFGSTNTVMAWKMYEKDANGNPVVSQNLNVVNNIIKIPSIMIFANENPDNGAVKYDLFGQDALNTAETANIPPVVCDNFKQLLYDNKPDTPEYERGKELCIKFFKYLYNKYCEEICNKIIPIVMSNMECILYLSTPVRANFQNSEMREIAVKAGFNNDNGITEINIDFDEAACVIRHAIDKYPDRLKNIFKNAGTDRGSLLLFADAGGSTLDLYIIRFYIKADGSFLADPIAKWPEPDIDYPLGGCLIDKAIRDYFIKEGYANEEYTLEKWETVDGKLRFRRFKEQNNKKLESGDFILDLGKVEDVCFDLKRGILPRKDYQFAQNRINANIYENDICKEYIEQFRKALKDLFNNQRKQNDLRVITPADIDGIFLTGAGSELYFMPRILLEDFDKETLGFVKVRANKEQLLFADRKDPSACCALGALTDDNSIDIPNYARGKYILNLEIYSHGSAIAQELKNGNIYLCPKNEVIKIHDIEFDCVNIASERFIISEKFQLLPIKSEFTKKITYDDCLHDHLTMQVFIQQCNDDGTIETRSKKFKQTTKRYFSDSVKAFYERVIDSTLGVIFGLPGALVNELSKKLGSKAELSEAYIDGVNKVFFSSKKIEVNVETKITLAENNTVSIETRMLSDKFKTAEDIIKINI